MGSVVNILFLVATLRLKIATGQLNTEPFPENFLFGVSSSAYQTEGAWNVSDKSESIWDYLTHNNPDLIQDRSNGDIASDSYNHFDEDVELLKELGVNFYRLSISWSRLLPSGFANRVSATGMRFYHNLINTLVDNDITPMVTLYHWDLPNKLQKLGGWANPVLADYFADFAQIVFENFGNKVKYWITFNDPAVFCKGYDSSAHAPVDLKMPGIGEYLCAKTVIMAHANAYHLYNNTYRSKQKGQIGISLGMMWYQPYSPSPYDMLAMDKAKSFNTYLYSHPIFSQSGGYPDDVVLTVGRRSSQEGFAHSRLPELTPEEEVYIKGTGDFIGLNHYTSVMVTSRDYPIDTPSVDADVGIYTWFNPSWKESDSPNIKVYPQGLSSVLETLHHQYGVPIIITENGVADNEEIDDQDRIYYIQWYLNAVQISINRGVDVIGYAVSSLTDNFGWLEGYANRYGLYHVNFSDPQLPRTRKSSALYYSQVIQARRLISTDKNETNGYNGNVNEF